MFTVKVAATSANVCIGFDVCGIALSIYDEFTFDESNKTILEGFEKEFSTPSNNLLFQAYSEVFKYLNKEIINAKITMRGDIPSSRGLGSSSALIVGGIFGANKILNNPLTKDECFNLATKLEGHPDNVAPAIYGNFVTSYKKGDKYYHNCYRVSDKLKLMVIIPDKRISTHEARGVLPSSYSINDCVYNLSGIINLPRALEDGNMNLLMDILDDRIHEPYRMKLIPKFEEIKKVCNNCNASLIISGSGSTMLVISDSYGLSYRLKEFGYLVKEVTVSDGVMIYEWHFLYY